jgi:hypothetical protein
VQDQGDSGGENDPLADNMRMNRPRRSAPTETLDTERSGSIFDQQTVVDSNFSGRSQARRQRQMSSPFTTQQLGTWAADPNNSRKLYLIGGVLLGVLFLLGLFYVYNRSGNNAVATDEDPALVTASEQTGAITLEGAGQASAPADFAAAPQQVPAVPNSDPAQQPLSAAGTAWVVTGTATEGLFLRRDHVVDPANILGTLPEGTRVQGLGQEFDDGTRKWQKVQSEQFGEGWVAADFLQPAP